MLHCGHGHTFSLRAAGAGSRSNARVAARLRGLEAQHVDRVRAGGHDNAIWDEEFSGALTWCFDRH